VTKALEQARTAKLIGHPLDASVTISANKDLYNDLHSYTEDLKSIFIVSQVSLIKEETLSGAYESNDIEGLSILIEPATGEKCERCWMHDSSVGTSQQHPTICKRCEENI
jgi:isoleucyl-tRNA synthetase